MKKNYGTVSHEEIIAGMKLATEIATKITAVSNPAVRSMIKDLIALIPVTKEGL